MRKRNRPAVVLLAALMMVFGVASAAGAEEGEEAGNNLSVPAVFLGTSPFTVECDGLPDDVTGDVGVEIAPGVFDHTDYYVQGVATWQAACLQVLEATAAAEWGDNLENAPLKQGTPIRTEIGFLAQDLGTMQGYTVVKLDPDLLDRESHYGTLGVLEDFAEVRVWAEGVTLTIEGDGGVVTDGVSYSAEINSTGRIVYGFNWMDPVAGDYTISVYAGGIELTSTDAGVLFDEVGDDGVYDTVKLDVTVGNKGKKGGGGNGGKRGDTPAHGGGGPGPKGPRTE